MQYMVKISHKGQSGVVDHLFFREVNFEFNATPDIENNTMNINFVEGESLKNTGVHMQPIVLPLEAGQSKKVDLIPNLTIEFMIV